MLNGYQSLIHLSIRCWGIILVVTALAGCDQWSTGYLRNASRDTITVRLRQLMYQRTGDSAGYPTFRKYGKWGVVRLGPRQSFQIGHNMGPTFTECMFDSVEASGSGFSVKLSREMIFNLPMEEQGYNYYYLIGWRREDE